ncbi:MAG: cupin fold metalloprotein, WbuC family [Elusimicrobia bacterium]|nr:cupin fold metalloprotein, WbuC family [Elusimicrobiota bacterium]
MSKAIYFNREFAAVTPEELSRLKQEAGREALKRARFCLHKSHDDKVQVMIIAVARGSYVGPHRQKGKSKFYQVIEGELLWAIFDEDGRLLSKTELGDPASGKPCVCRFLSDYWHVIEPLSDSAVYTEVLEGPYVKEGTEFASWGPDSSSPAEIARFLASLRA